MLIGPKMGTAGIVASYLKPLPSGLRAQGLLLLGSPAQAFSSDRRIEWH